jgi:hypothetical protein
MGHGRCVIWRRFHGPFNVTSSAAFLQKRLPRRTLSRATSARARNALCHATTLHGHRPFHDLLILFIAPRRVTLIWRAPVEWPTRRRRWID